MREVEGLVLVVLGGGGVGGASARGPGGGSDAGGVAHHVRDVVLLVQPVEQVRHGAWGGETDTLLAYHLSKK